MLFLICNLNQDFLQLGIDDQLEAGAVSSIRSIKVGRVFSIRSAQFEGQEVKEIETTAFRSTSTPQDAEWFKDDF